MELAIKKRQEKKGKTINKPIPTTTNSFLEINHYFSQPRLRQEDCFNPIPWWGVGLSVLSCYIGFNHLLVPTWDPVLQMMARDYLAIPATTCIAERSFSLSARTDDPR